MTLTNSDCNKQYIYFVFKRSSYAEYNYNNNFDFETSKPA